MTDTCTATVRQQFTSGMALPEPNYPTLQGSLINVLVRNSGYSVPKPSQMYVLCGVYIHNKNYARLVNRTAAATESVWVSLSFFHSRKLLVHSPPSCLTHLYFILRLPDVDRVRPSPNYNSLVTKYRPDSPPCSSEFCTIITVEPSLEQPEMVVYPSSLILYFVNNE